MNPITEGLRIALGPDAFPKGYGTKQLTDIMYQLSASSEDADLMTETESLAIMDSAYNEGEVLESMVLDAVTARYNRLPRTMAALQRVFNKHLRSGESELIAEAPVVGDPKKGSLFATVTVQFPFSDGQVLSVVFHSPGGDARKVMPDDNLIAFRWLMNKRDITQVVAPEVEKGEARDISLDTVGRRVTQLITANSEKFQKRQSEVAQTRKELEEAKATVESLTDQQQSLTNEVVELDNAQQELDTEILSKQGRLEELQQTNADLEAQVEALRSHREDQQGESQTSEQDASSGGDIDTTLMQGISGKRALAEYIEENFSFGSRSLNDLLKSDTRKKETQKYVHLIELYNTLWESAANQNYHATKANLEQVFGNYLGISHYDARGISNKRTSLARDLKPISIDFTFEDMLTKKLSVADFMAAAIKTDTEEGLQESDIDSISEALKSIGFNKISTDDSGFERTLQANFEEENKLVRVTVSNAKTTGFYAEMHVSLYLYKNYENGSTGEYRSQDKMIAHVAELLEQWGMSQSPDEQDTKVKLGEETRKALLNEIWGKTHKDYKSVVDGARYTMMMTDKGASLVSLESLTDSQIKEQVGKDVWEQYTHKQEETEEQTTQDSQGINLWGTPLSTEEAVETIKNFMALKPGDAVFSIKAVGPNKLPVVAKKHARKIVDEDGISHSIKDLTGMSTSQINEAFAAIEYEQNGGKTVVQPAAKQSGQPAKNIARLLHNLKLQEKVMEGEDFHVRLKNKPYQDLVIERHPLGDDQRLYLTHYYEQGGDQIMDAEMVFRISPTGLLTLAETATSSPRGEMRGFDNSFASMFSKNLNNQGFGDATVPGTEEEKDMNTETETDSEETGETSTDTGTEQPEAVTTLESIINGQFDNKTSDEVQDMLMQALEALESQGLAQEYDSILGKAAEKYVELADKESL